MPYKMFHSVAELDRIFSKHTGDITGHYVGFRWVPYRHVRYDKQTKSIEVETWKGCEWYPVDLKRCQTAAACLDWIHQLHEKAWYDADREHEFIDLLLRLVPSRLWAGKAG